MANKPAHKITSGALRVTIWENSGEKGTFYSVTPSRGYKDKDGTWKESDSFAYDELLTVAKLLDQAHTWIQEQKAKRPAAEEQEAA